MVVVANIFDEVRVFLDCLADPHARARLFALLPGNVLDRDEAIGVAEAFNGLEAGTLAHLGEESEAIFHPFRDLYFTGLLGVVQRDAETGAMTQRFRKPHDPFGACLTALPDSVVYLLHPALDNVLRGQRRREGFLQQQHITVGENLPWLPHFTAIVQLEKQLAQVTDEAFIERVHAVVTRVQGLLAASRSPLARAEVETSDAWRELRGWSGVACDETRLWLEELLSML